MTSRNPPTQAEFHAAISSRSDRWYSACLKITRDADLAQDAVQDALLSAWDKRKQFDHSARLDTWIHRIAINAALQLLRKNRPGAFESIEFDVEETAPGPATLHAEAQLGNTLAAALRHLSEFERICFVLKHLEQWRLAEIAAEIDTNTGAVKQAIFRAVKKLRIHMASLQRETS